MSETLETMPPALLGQETFAAEETDLRGLREAYARLRQEKEQLEVRVRQGEERRRAMIHIIHDMNQLNKKLAHQRKAMLHIMGDLSETTAEMQRREQELRDRQEQLVQAGKLFTLGELTTGVAHELNNPLNNIGFFVALPRTEASVAETASRHPFVQGEPRS